MENQLTAQQKQQLQLKEHATGLIAILTDAEKAKEFERSLSIQKIVDTSLPISVIRNYSGMSGVKQAIDIQLTKLVASLNLKWNLHDNQIAQIVEDVVDKYQNETIEDFVLVFRRARMGEFGELFRLDGPVIFSWMETYLEEKYAVIENKLAKEKEEFYKPVKNVTADSEWLQKWKDAVDKVNAKPVMPISEKQICEEGRIKPKANEYVPPGLSELKKRELHFRWLSENHDARTGDKLDHWMEESKWLELNT